jgi:hypothetical protein
MDDKAEGKNGAALAVVKGGAPEGFRELTEVERMRIEILSLSLRAAQEAIGRWEAERDNAEARLSTARAELQGTIMAVQANDQAMGLTSKDDVVKDKEGKVRYVRIARVAPETEKV